MAGTTKPGNEVVKRGSLLTTVAGTYKMDPDEFKQTVMGTVFKDVKTDSEFLGMLTVCNEIGLNPLLKEIYAFRNKHGQLLPMVGVDGYSRKANESPQYDGYEVEYSDVIIEPGDVPGLKHRTPEYAEVAIYRKDRSHPTKARCYISQSFRPDSTAWLNNPTWMMMQRALSRALKLAFGLSGTVPSEEEADEWGGEVITGEATDESEDVTVSQETLAEIRAVVPTKDVGDGKPVSERGVLTNVRRQFGYDGPLEGISQTIAEAVLAGLSALPDLEAPEKQKTQRASSDPLMAKLCILWNEVIKKGLNDEKNLRAWMKASYEVDSRSKLSDEQKTGMIEALETALV